MATVSDTKFYTEAKHTAYAVVDGAEPVSVGLRAFTPQRMTVNYDWRTQLGHQEWHPRCVELSGRWVGVDGNEPPAGSGTVLLLMSDAPDWARAFVDANLPTLVLAEGH